MRTFKQFKVGDVEYTLSFEAFTHVHKDSGKRAYLRIEKVEHGDSYTGFYIGISRRKHVSYEWSWTFKDYGYQVNSITDQNKAQECRRLIMLFLTNSL